MEMRNTKYKRGEILVEETWARGGVYVPKLVRVRGFHLDYHRSNWEGFAKEYEIRRLDGTGGGHPEVESFEKNARRLTKKESFLFYTHGHKVVEDLIESKRKDFNKSYMQELIELNDWTEIEIQYIMKHLPELLK